MSEENVSKILNEDSADRMMRESVKDFRVEPTPGLWKGISRRLLWSEILHLNFTNISSKFWIGGLAGVVILASTLVLTLGGSHKDNPETATHPVPAPSTGSGTSRISAPATRVVTVGSSAVTSGQNASTRPSPITTTLHKANSSHESVALTTAVNRPGVTKTSPRSAMKQTTGTEFTEIPPEVRETISPAEISPIPEIAPTPTDRFFSGITPVKPVEAILPMTQCSPDTILFYTVKGKPFRVQGAAPKKVGFLSAGLGIKPEMAKYTQPRSHTKVNFWVDGRLTYHFSRFSVATGLGVGYVFDEGLYKVDYKSLDSVGYYNSVVSYTVGTSNEIIYNTSATTVYDSLVHVADPRASNRYSYLQVPLLVGYRFYESNKFSFTLQAGPAVSFLMGTRKASPELNYPNARILLVNDQTPSRIRTGLQVWAELYGEMRMTRRLSVYLEPSFRYHVKSLVGDENTTYKAPWAVGLGIGLQFNIGPLSRTP